MARPKSEEKRLALLDAATEIVAEQGLGAPTAQIARQAGVAEGTLFRYFPTKEALLNDLYLHLNGSMCAAITARYVPDAPLRERVQALWNSYIDWGLAHPAANRAVNQLSVSSVITPETVHKGEAMFPDMGIADGFAAHPVFDGQPTAFADAIFMALADTTMNFAAREPHRAGAYKASGFEALWKMYRPE